MNKILQRNPFLNMTKEPWEDLLLGNKAILLSEEEKLAEQFAHPREVDSYLKTLSLWNRLKATKRLKKLLALGFLIDHKSLSTYESLPLSSVDLEITAHCQAKCPICPRDIMPREKTHMSEAIFYRLIEELLPFNSTVFLSGLGDPLLHPQFLTYLKHLRAMKLPARLVTNGNLLTPKMRQGIFECGLDHVSISFQAATEATYQETMALPFKETQDLVKAFVLEARGKIPVTLCFVASDQNAHEARIFENAWRNLGVQTLVTQVHNRGGFTTNPKVHAKARDTLNQNISRCGLFNTRIFVSCTGDVLACCNDMTGKEKLGNILSDRLQSILEAKKKRILEKNLFKMCLVCDDPSRLHVIKPQLLENS